MLSKNLLRCTMLMICFVVSHACFSQVKSDCASITDNKARLECYDNLSARDRALKEQVTKPTVKPAETPLPSAATPEADFGKETMTKKELESTTDKRAAEQLIGKVKSVRTKLDGTIIVELDSEQVWIEIDHTTGRPPKVGDTVTIRLGMFGSYFMSGKSGVALRVRRMR